MASTNALSRAGLNEWVKTRVPEGPEREIGMQQRGAARILETTNRVTGTGQRWSPRLCGVIGGLAMLLTLPVPALGQGQDSTPGERYVRVMAELLPGTWDNASQAYFDRRRGLETGDRHDRVHTRITRVDAPAFGAYAFLWTSTVTTADGERSTSHRLATLSADGAPDEVVMRHYISDHPLTEAELTSLKPEGLRRTEGCDYFFKRRASAFRGAQKPGACAFDWEGQAVTTANVIELSEDDLFFNDHKTVAASGERITGVASGEPYWLERARHFTCHVDMPGVGGGRDEPFERYADIGLHDKGGVHWFMTREEPPRRMGLSLMAVTWQVLNEDNGNFNRDSLVIYVSEELEGGERKEHGYAFTAPDAERIGVNLKWLLANCSLVPPSVARPEL